MVNEQIRKLIQARRISNVRLAQTLHLKPNTVSSLLTVSEMTAETEARFVRAIRQIEEQDLEQAEKILAETAETET